MDPFGCGLTNMSGAGRNGSRSTVKSSPTLLATFGMSAARGRAALPSLLELGRSDSHPMIRLSQFWKEFDTDPKERTAMELKTLVRGLWLSGVHDQLNTQTCAVPRRVARRACQLVKDYESTHGKPNWSSVKWSTSVHSRLQEDEGVKTENLSLCATKTIPVFEDGSGSVSPLLTCLLRAANPRVNGKKRKGRGSSQLLRPRYERQIGQC